MGTADATNSPLSLEHRPYDKIPLVLEAEEQDITHTVRQWVVTEKIHGANFSFITNGIDCAHARRTAVLQPKENFFNFRSIAPMIDAKAKRIYAMLLEKHSDLDRVIIFGELFGGMYPHPDVPRSNVSEVQREVFYSPTINFCTFDIFMETAEFQDYLGYEQTVELCRKVELMYAEPLFIGAYHEAINFNYKFPTTIPQKFDLPPIKDNIAEGIVVKPYQHVEYNEVRPIVKIKNWVFNEKVTVKKPPTQKKVTKKRPATFAGLKFKVNDFIVKPRLDNAISKVGRVSIEDEKGVNELHQLFVKDILEDYVAEYGASIDAIQANAAEGDLMDAVRVYTEERAMDFVNKHLDVIPDENKEDSESIGLFD